MPLSLLLNINNSRLLRLPKITFVDRPDSPEVLDVEVGVGEELRGGDA